MVSIIEQILDILMRRAALPPKIDGPSAWLGPEESTKQHWQYELTDEDLIELEDKSIQTLMLEVTQDMLVVALKGASPKLREKIFKNMAKRAADTVREDLAARGPTKVADVEDAQKQILTIGRMLHQEGRIIMERKKEGGDAGFL